MEYVQERITTLHDLADPVPKAPTARAAVVVPMTHREVARPASRRVFSVLERVDPTDVIVPVRAPTKRIDECADWLGSFELDLTVLWCNAPEIGRVLEEHDLAGEMGKGRDVWLGLGVAAERAEYIVVHDADATTYGPEHVPRLLAPLAAGYDFSKGYYARIENGRLYGRLLRLFYEPLVSVLCERHNAPILDYLGAFRYALAGEMAMTADLAREIRAEPVWGFEIGALGEAFAHAGFEATAQVDLGVHQHDHRGTGGLAEMSGPVGAALFRVLADEGIDPDFDTLPGRYRASAEQFVRGYAADAAFNGLDYDPDAERAQVDHYAESITPPGADPRLPAWVDAPIDSEAVVAAAGVEAGDDL